jgi:hypothetical protein
LPTRGWCGRERCFTAAPAAYLVRTSMCTTNYYNPPVFTGRFKRYCTFPWLKRLALAVIAKGLNESQEQPLKEARLQQPHDCVVHLSLTNHLTLAASAGMGVVRPRQRRNIGRLPRAGPGGAAILHASARPGPYGRRGAGVAGWCAVTSLYNCVAMLRGRFVGLDLNRDNIITFTEFAAALMPRLYYLNERAIGEVFSGTRLHWSMVILSHSDVLLLQCWTWTMTASSRMVTSTTWFVRSLVLSPLSRRLRAKRVPLRAAGG